MRQKFDAVFAAIIAVTLVVGGLWLWNIGPHPSADSDNNDHALWTARCAAVAAIAAAQVLGLGPISRVFFHKDAISEILRAVAALVCTAATIGTLTLVWTVS